MEILEVASLIFPEVKTISYARFSDERGFFAEVYKRSDFQNNAKLHFLKNKELTQINISYSKKGVVRGLHFQLNPKMDKLVRIIQGRMIDVFMDIRIGSPNFGKIAAYEMSSHEEDRQNQWIWIPVGFAHGVVFLENTLIEYICTAEYNLQGEVTISPIAKDIDWSLCDENLKAQVYKMIKERSVMSEKDKSGLSVSGWKNHPDSQNLLFKR